MFTNTSCRLWPQTVILSCLFSCCGKETSNPDISHAPGADNACKEHTHQGHRVVPGLVPQLSLPSQHKGHSQHHCSDPGHREADGQLPGQVRLQKEPGIHLRTPRVSRSIQELLPPLSLGAVHWRPLIIAVVIQGNTPCSVSGDASTGLFQK